MEDQGENTLSVHDAVEIAARGIDELPTLTVTGEVSGFRGPNARSGHCYFQIKDESSSMDAIVWRGIYQACGFQLKDGLKIQVRGKFNIYEASGKLSFVARSLAPAGEGLLRQQVAERARRLEKEGLMDAARKRLVPRFCERIVICTSLSGSVIEDCKRTLARRNPLVAIQVVGCPVQGSQAAPAIIRALQVAASVKPDAILLVRGGGSYEDLMCFNDEALARAVAACPVPVVSGIGHEPDVTICDMVADKRCSTPTAAAEAVAPAIDEIERSINDRQIRLVRTFAQMLATQRAMLEAVQQRSVAALRSRLSQEKLKLDALSHRRSLAEPRSFIEDRREQLELTEERLHAAIPHALSRKEERVSLLAHNLRASALQLVPHQKTELEHLASRLSVSAGDIVQPHALELKRLAATLDALSPLRVLARGYAIVRDDEGQVVRSAKSLKRGSELELSLAEGTAKATVTSVFN